MKLCHDAMSAVVREPEYVINTRGGSVLGKKTILKSDHFPGCQNKRLQPHVEGAPNYRQVRSLPVYGVAIPTVDGIRRVLELVGANKHGPKIRVLWHNLREEPVIYINGRPYVLREVERPFTNLEYTGINRARVEQMEARLKEDILQEASRFTNKVLVNDELPDGQMVDLWEPVTQDSVQTPLEVYEALQSEGYNVDYERVPITDEKSPKERDFDLLVQHLSRTEIGTALIFNCQMGRGRTTTGMVVATLVYLKRVGLSGMTRSSSFGLVLQAGELCNDVPDSEEAVRRGEYTVIRSLIRVLEGGVEGKRQVDHVIDKCSAMQNLREAIAGYRNSIQRQADEKKREAALSFFVEYLERYYFLICFAVYIHTDQCDLSAPNASTQHSFQAWMKARPELYSILRRLLRRDPMGALSFSSNPPGFMKKNSEIGSDRPSDTEGVVAMRNGEVLGRETVLKSDHCPGCQNLSLSERIEGAPNFREVLGFPVYGVANPTKDGICAVLRRIGGGHSGRPVLWHNMREEPMVYINGNPFVLREVKRPFKNMLEYTGIDRDRVEKMESRLKEDVLREAERYNGAIMVNHETDDGQIFDVWEKVTADSVQTPFEVFKDLESAGYPVQYARLPITDGKAPRSSDFGTLAAKIASATKDTAFVFNCQMGRGRTTTGTVIACLVKLRCDFGRPMVLPAYPDESSDVDSASSSGDEAGTQSENDTITSKATIERQSSLSGFVMDDIPLIRKITRLLENGVENRVVLDAVIDRCAIMQNLRQAVLHYRKVFNNQNLEHHKRQAALRRGAEYLERYFQLIAFVAYLNSEAFDGYCIHGGSGTTFKSWLQKTPEIQEMKWSIRLRPAQVFAIPEVEFRSYGDLKEGDPVMEAVVKARNGSVLVKRSILKMYFFPGQRKSSGSISIEGAPHFCKVDGVPVYSSATPTVDGARAILSHLKATPIKEGVHMSKVVITDLREEVVVYIHGYPFVLRELEQPVHTLKHVGISGPAIEQMERRLKEDILSEASRSSGRVLLHREEFNPVSNKTDIIGYWEAINSDDVCTPVEMYENLKKEGSPIDYERLPLTREREVVAADVDAIHRRIKGKHGDVSYLFVSHTGYGGIAYALAISCLFLQAQSELADKDASTSKHTNIRYAVPLATQFSALQKQNDVEEAYQQGDYRDVLSLTRVLANGPISKVEVDEMIDRCQVVGNLRRDIFYYRQQLKSCRSITDDFNYNLDMGIKALRRYCFLIAFRSYLYNCMAQHSSLNGGEKYFSDWMRARPELAHICNHLKLE
ncbi:hypothetical protein KP509_03G093600 [Ceratopteris richardii]|uniref:Paladin n=1 Tax=Ceratopteris richardii TaxID=49495 RepID=A0A8T2V977_CERRI|nr:hypothetical protein KP509_03G093600 [Ceratopteris richardii]